MSATPKAPSEVITPGMKRVIAALMQKMEKNLKDHYAAELAGLRSEINLLKVKITQLEKEQKKSSHLPLATAMTLAGSTPKASALVKLTQSSDDAPATASTTAGGLAASERAKRKAEWRLKKQRTTTFTVGANDLEADIAARRKARAASEADSAAAAAIVSAAKAKVGLPKSLMSENKEDDLKLSADDKATRDALKSLLKSTSEHSILPTDGSSLASSAVPASGAGGLSLAMGAAGSSSESAGPKSPKSGALAIMTPTAQETIALLSLDIASDTDEEDPIAVARSLPSGLRSVPTAASVAKRRKQMQPRKRTTAETAPKKRKLAGTGKKTGGHSKVKSYKAPRTSFAHIDQIYIGNRYALTDGRWGICKYYDPKSDTLGIELEMGIGEKSSMFRGKERWPLTGGAHACFISRKKVESDCGRP